MIIHFVHGCKLPLLTSLSRKMFIDRANQFYHRLNWSVSINEDGEERDVYDSLNPVYIICEYPRGHHAGSLRLLPTTNRTMLNEHFSHTTGGLTISNPHIWECTKLCAIGRPSSQIAAALFSACMKAMGEMKIDKIVAVFDDRIERVYSAFGVKPVLLGTYSQGNDFIASGFWSHNQDDYLKLLEKANLRNSDMDNFFQASLSNGLLMDKNENHREFSHKCDFVA